MDGCDACRPASDLQARSRLAPDAQHQISGSIFQQQKLKQRWRQSGEIRGKLVSFFSFREVISMMEMAAVENEKGGTGAGQIPRKQKKGAVTISLTSDRASQQLRESPLVIGDISCHGWCFRAKDTIPTSAECCVWPNQVVASHADGELGF